MYYGALKYPKTYDEYYLMTQRDKKIKKDNLYHLLNECADMRAIRAYYDNVYKQNHLEAHRVMDELCKEWS